MMGAMRSIAIVFALVSLARVTPAQGIEDVTARGEKVFQETCSTGYCHGAKGTAGGAPRLVGRGFDQGFITATVTRGVPGTAMRAFATSLDRRDLTAVIAYVASLNGIAGRERCRRTAGDGAFAGSGARARSVLRCNAELRTVFDVS